MVSAFPACSLGSNAQIGIPNVQRHDGWKEKMESKIIKNGAARDLRSERGPAP